MKTQELKKIIDQLRRYELTKAFDSPEELDKWLEGLNDKQIHNLITLNLDPNKIDVPASIMVNENLLNCSDYSKRLEAFTKIQNCEGCYHLYSRFCSIYFLRRKSFYEDIDLIAKAPTARYVLWVIGEEEFNNSKYRDEDLKLIVEAKDIEKEDENAYDNTWLVAEALASVAGDKASINSKYHREDMRLIAKSGSDCLQMTGSYPEYGLNKLAKNEVSLSDPYHLENMKILAENPESAVYLYKLMTDKDFIKRPTYRQEIDALRYAKSEVTALAMYNFITNAEIDNHFEITELMRRNNLEFINGYELGKHETIDGINHPNYLESLYLLNEVDDEFVLFFSELLRNKSLLESGYQDQDLDLLLTVSDVELFMDLFKLMSNEYSCKFNSHLHDIEILLQTEDKEKRRALLLKATDKFSLSTPNHCYDMEYIAKLNREEVDKTTFNKMHYYLFNKNGMSKPNHVEILEKLFNGIPVDSIDEVDDHLSRIEENIEEYIASNPSRKKGFLARLLRRK